MLRVFVLLVVPLTACAASNGEPATGVDAGPPLETDSGLPPAFVDAARPLDAGSPVPNDAGAPDAGALDGGPSGFIVITAPTGGESFFHGVTVRWTSSGVTGPATVSLLERRGGSDRVRRMRDVVDVTSGVAAFSTDECWPCVARVEAAGIVTDSAEFEIESD